MIELEPTPAACFDDDVCPDCGYAREHCACEYCEIDPGEPLTFHGVVLIFAVVVAFAIGWAWGACS